MTSSPALQIFKQIPLIRNSERSDFKACQQRWWWRWVEGLVPAMPRHDARAFGSAWHLALAEYYTPPPGAKNGFTRGRDMHETWDEAMGEVYNTIPVGLMGEEYEREWVDSKILGHMMIDGYMNRWHGDPQWEVLMPEQRFRARITFNARQSKRSQSHWLSLGLQNRAYIGEIVGTFDMPIRDHSDGHIKIVDHKTAAAYDPVLSYLIKDDQAGVYIAVGTQALRAAGYIDENEAITGMIFNFARKTKYDDRPQNALGQYLNKDGSVSKKQPAPYFWRENVERTKANRLRQLSRIADDIEQMQTIREGLLGITKAPGRQCSWCDFKDLCDIDEDGGDVEQFKKDVFKRTDPYADHREGAINSKATVEDSRS